MHRTSSRTAFTLVELSIVMVIIGLLVGSVLAGQSLIRAAELRGAAAEYNSFTTAIGNFRDQYRALPGDIPNAQNYWGVRDPVYSNCPNVPADDKTCNGNNNGLIDTSFEGMFAWQHLAKAGFIEGGYNGTYIGGLDIQAGVNIPPSRLREGAWTIFPYLGPGDGIYTPFNTYKSAFSFGATTPGNTVSGQPALRPAEAWNLDTKLDDGNPVQGNIMTWLHAAFPGTDCINAANTAYATDLTGISCSLIINTGY